MDALLDLLRWFNAFGFLLVTVGFAVRVRRTWAARDRSERRFTVALLGLFAVVAYGSLESYLTAAPFGWRVPLTTLALGGLMHGLLSAPQPLRER